MIVFISSMLLMVIDPGHVLEELIYFMGEN